MSRRSTDAPDPGPLEGARRSSEHQIVVRLDALLADRGMTLTELAERVGVTIANMSVLKNGHAKAIRFNTLTAICRELECTPGDVLTYAPAGRADPDTSSAAGPEAQDESGAAPARRRVARRAGHR